MNEKTLVLTGTLLTILLGVFASLIAWFMGGDKLSGNAREVIRQMFNFEITIVLIGAVLSFIPVVGQILGMLLILANLIIAIKAYTTFNKNGVFKAPAIEFIK